MSTDKDYDTLLWYKEVIARMSYEEKKVEKTGKGLCLVENCKDNCKEKYGLEQ